MTKEFKRLLIIIFIIIYNLSNSSLVLTAVIAQDATSSATPINSSPTPTITPTSPTNTPQISSPTQGPTTNDQRPTTPPSPTPQPATSSPTVSPYTNALPLSVTPGISPLPTLSITSPSQQGSGRFRQKLSLLPLEKSFYKSGEKIKARLLNDYGQPLQIVIRDTSGREIPLIMEKEQSTEESTLSFTPTGLTSFRPGKYRLMITDPDGITHSQEFTWGVLAINTNKSVYTPGDQAVISMAVLDDNGSMVCDAKMQLDIIAPDGEKTTLGTWDEGIKVTDFCHVRTLTYTPDYLTTYDIPGKTGNYQMILSAETINGKRIITDQFQVKDNVPFDVERVTATRIFPINLYDVRMKVIANQDFSGKITEPVPASFIIGKPKDGPSLGFDEIATKSATLKNARIIGQYFTPYSLPFRGNFPTTLNFDEVSSISYLQERYEKYGLKSHDGVDYAMPVGTAVISIDKGKVIVAGWDNYGITVVVEHSWGKSYYGHLSKTSVSVGEEISAGTTIGDSGSTGLSTGPHLHFSIEPNNPNLKNGFRGKVNPRIFLSQNQQNPQNLDLITQELIWNISIKKGETVVLGYNYDSPDISPQLYLLGPLKFQVPIGREQIPDPAPTLSLPSSTPSPTISESLLMIQNNSDSSISSQIASTPSASPAVTSDSAKVTEAVSDSTALTLNAHTRDSLLISSLPKTESRSYSTVFEEYRQWQIAVDADVLINATTANTASKHQNKAKMVFVSDKVGYMFYPNAGTTCSYSKTTDGGANWGGEVNISDSLVVLDCANVVIWYDRWTPGDITGTYIHISYFDTDATQNNVYYDRIDTGNSDAAFTEVIVNTDSTDLVGLDKFSITKSTSAILYIALNDNSSGSKVSQCTLSTGCDAGGEWTDVGTNPMDSAQDSVILEPLKSGNIMLIRQDISAEDLQYKIWNGSSWDVSWTNISTNCPDNAASYPSAIAAAVRRYNYNIYLACVFSPATLDTAEINTWVYDGSSWTQKTDVVTDVDVGAAESVFSIDLAIDEESGDIYAIYGRGTSTDVEIVYKKSTDDMTNWSAQSASQNTTYTAHNNQFSFLNVVNSDRIYFAYWEFVSKDYYGGTIADLLPPTLDEILKHGEWWSKTGARQSISF